MGAGGADRLRGGRGGLGGRRALHGSGHDESAGDAGAEAAGGGTTHGAGRDGTGDGERPSRGESGGVSNDVDGGAVGRRTDRGLVDGGAAAGGWAWCGAAQRHWCVDGGCGAGDSGTAAGRVPGRRRPLASGAGSPDLASGRRIASGRHLCRTHHLGLDGSRPDSRHHPAGAGGWVRIRTPQVRSGLRPPKSEPKQATALSPLLTGISKSTQNRRPPGNWVGAVNKFR